MKKALERILARGLALDPATPERIKKCAGRVVLITLKGTGIRFQMVFEETHIKLLWEDFRPADLSISATPLSLLYIKFSRHRQKLFADEVTVTGSMTLARDVMTLFEGFEPDWEEWLAERIGDVPANGAGRMMRGLRQSLQQVTRRLSDNVSEFLQEEAALCPPRRALQDFYAAVDDLRLEIDRLEARLSQPGGYP